jgi:phosphoenolpyruvate carboxykinase (ATP)
VTKPKHNPKFMDNYGLFTKTIALDGIGISNAMVKYQLSPEELHDITIKNGQGIETSTGALAINTGEFTGRAPEDRFIVKDSITEGHVWWGKVNLPFDPVKFDALYDKVMAYLNNKSEVFVRDSYVCADANYRLNVRCVTETAWSNLFCYNMFMRPTEEQLEDFTADWHVVCAPGFEANPEVDGTRSPNFAILNFTRKIALVGGTGYTGEMKKGIFSALNFILPVFKNTLPMHCSANVGEDGDTAIFFGLSGTGKTTLSADPTRHLIGDDEHGWTSENTVFNFEGGCYAKVINLTEENEPDIYRAVKKGALLENVIFKPGTKEVDYTDVSITPNTRVSYPITHINNIQPGSIGHNPKNIFFLSADSFGILPPISKLTPGQAAYWFISGYTAKVAGTELGVKEPQPNFSACFGAPFMPLNPTVYAEMLSDKMKEAGVNVWLINTGWTGGAYGTGSRMKLSYTRSMITAALNGWLEGVEYKTDPVFGLAVPQSCPNVPDAVLNPRDTWANGAEYDEKARELAGKFRNNFTKFESFSNNEIIAGGPLA